jgi:hypothetical protein
LDISGEKQQAMFEPFRETMSGLWLDGLTCAEIAVKLGWTPASIQRQISRYRMKGYLAEFPHRRSVRNARSGVAA